MDESTDAGIGCNPDIIVYHIGTGHVHAAGYHYIATYLIVMSNVAQVIDFCMITNDRIGQSPSVYAGIGSHFHIISNYQPAYLRETEPISILVLLKTEPGTAKHCTSLDVASFAKDYTIIDTHIAVYHATSAYACLANDAIRSDIYILTHLRLCINNGSRMDTWLRTLHKEGISNLCQGTFGVLYHNEDFTRYGQHTLIHQHDVGFAILYYLLTVRILGLHPVECCLIDVCHISQIINISSGSLPIDTHHFISKERQQLAQCYLCFLHLATIFSLHKSSAGIGVPL